ncbi:MAG: type IV pilin protein [Planctomycetota bacterium]|jgi:prepilin-type N-terminal cleavage/methylation domain-containing protein
MKAHQKAFTLIELMVVILIVGVLAAAMIPLMKGKIDSSKWAEANAAAGMIRQAERTYYMETGSTVTGVLSDTAKLTLLGIGSGDLNGTYFVAGDYNITAVSSAGMPTVQVTGSQTNAPSGTKTLTVDGDWQ